MKVPSLAGRLGASAVSLAFAVLGSCAINPNPTATPQHLDLQARTTMPSNEQPVLARSPLDLEDLQLLQGSLLFGPDDVEALRMSLPLVERQAEQILDVWYGFVGSTPQLVRYFGHPQTGAPNPEYLARVRERFHEWILVTAGANYAQGWLDLQYEIGLRHHTTKKNRTDGVEAAPIVHFRYLPALVYPVTATLRPFLESGDHSAEEVERMHQAWIKSVLLQSILWSYPYVRDGEF